MTEDTKNEVETENFTQIIETPTRFWTNQADSIIDQIWVNTPEKVLKHKNMKRAVADHNMIQITYRLKGNNIRNNEIMKRNRSNFNIDEYRNEINKIDWDKLYQFDNIDLAYSYLEENILRIYDKMAPMGKCQPRKGNTNWLSRVTRDKMVLRDLKHKKSKYHPRSE